MWADYIRKLVPCATIVRDFNFKSSQIAGQVLLSSHNDFDLKPDLLIEIPSIDGTDSIAVGIEIERTLKANNRIEQKIFGLATRTRLDGLIYICSSESIADALHNIYRSRVLDNALRIKHYGSNFVVVSAEWRPQDQDAIVMVNAGVKPVPLAHWIYTLASTDLHERRDSLFEKGRPEAPLDARNQEPH